jgi:DNA-binding transcriptional LysR family regulator
MMHDVDTQLLRTFVSLAETCSFSRTGARVGRSQSAISGQVAKLETALGVRLFTRDTRNVALTPEGERLLPDARSMVAQADAMLARFRTPDLSGLVRFGSPEDFASVYLPDILGVFAAAHPAVELHVTCQLTLPLISEFEAGEHDLIVIKQDPARPYPGARALWRERLVWVAAPHFNASRGTVPLVLSPAPCVYRARALGALETVGWTWHSVYTSPSFAGAVAAVRAGLGAMVIPETMVPNDLRIRDDWPTLAEAEMALLMPERPAPAVGALATFITDKVRR